MFSAARDVACSVWKNCICFGFCDDAVRPAAGTRTYWVFFVAMALLLRRLSSPHLPPRGPVGPEPRAALPPTRCLQSPKLALRFIARHRPSSTGWDEVFAKDRSTAGAERAGRRLPPEPPLRPAVRDAGDRHYSAVVPPSITSSLPVT